MGDPLVDLIGDLERSGSIRMHPWIWKEMVENAAGQSVGLDPSLCFCAEHRHRRGSSARRPRPLQGHQERRLSEFLCYSASPPTSVQPA